MKQEYWVGLGVVAALVAGYLFLPAWQAGQRYAVASSSVERCRAAHDAAAAWAGLGFASKYNEWESEAVFPCLAASAGR